MKWKHTVGLRRVCRKFLLLPKTIGYETRWFEIASWAQVECYNPYAFHSWYWDDMHWINNKEDAMKWLEEGM